MHLEHINLFVKDMDATLKFYRAAFPHWQIRSQGRASWYGTPRNWIHFGDEYQYLAFSDSATGENRDLESMNVGLSHFAFVTNNIESTIKRLRQAGYPVAKDGATSKFRKNFYCIDPSGYEVEFVEYLSDIPSERNQDE
ncbi:VOC family protein [Thalassotalea crassostreae]|uniref:VOC family protein n=1 Tax=Thalassotalea crassostreae TaxID=1763536 RepID=UPI00083953DE|nr:VOC family protein [Thalassotalea crassostreae]